MILTTYKPLKMSMQTPTYLYLVKQHEMRGEIQNRAYLWRTRNMPHKIKVPVTRIHPEITKLHKLEQENIRTFKQKTIAKETKYKKERTAW